MACKKQVDCQTPACWLFWWLESTSAKDTHSLVSLLLIIKIVLAIFTVFTRGLGVFFPVPIISDGQDKSVEARIGPTLGQVALYRARFSLLPHFFRACSRLCRHGAIFMRWLYCVKEKGSSSYITDAPVHHKLHAHPAEPTRLWGSDMLGRGTHHPVWDRGKWRWALKVSAPSPLRETQRGFWSSVIEVWQAIIYLPSAPLLVGDARQHVKWCWGQKIHCVFVHRKPWWIHLVMAHCKFWIQSNCNAFNVK